MAAKFLTGIDVFNQKITSLGDPSNPTDAVNLQTLQNFLAGLRWKAPVRVATTANGTLATAYANGQAVDGVVLVTGDRVLLKNQTAQTENGIYTVPASGAPPRATDADSTSDLDGATVFVIAGTVNKDLAYTQITDAPAIGSSNIVWVQFGGGVTYTADGVGIELSGTQFQLELDGTSLSKSASGLRIGSAAAGDGLVESGGILSVGAGTGITVTANAVAVDTSIVSRKFAVTIGDGVTTSFAITHGLSTRDVSVTIYEAAGAFGEVEADVSHDLTTQVTLTFNVAPTSSQYRVVIEG